MKGLDAVVSFGQVALKLHVIYPKDARWAVHVWSRGLSWSCWQGHGHGVILESIGLGESVMKSVYQVRKAPVKLSPRTKDQVRAHMENNRGVRGKAR